MSIEKSLVEIEHDSGYGSTLLDHINGCLAGKDMRAARIVNEQHRKPPIPTTRPAEGESTVGEPTIMQGDESGIGLVLKTKAEVAKYFGVHIRTVADWLQQPTFPGRAGSPGVRNGHYPVMAIFQWLQNGGRERATSAVRTTGLKDSNGTSINIGSFVRKAVAINTDFHGAWAIYEVKTVGIVPILSYLESEKGKVLPAGYLAMPLSDEYDAKLFLFAVNPSDVRPTSSMVVVRSVDGKWVPVLEPATEMTTA